MKLPKFVDSPSPTEQEAVPVGWITQPYPGATCSFSFHAPKALPEDWIVLPLYSHPPQPKVSVAEAAQVLLNAIKGLDGIPVVNMDKQQKALFLLDRLALHALKGGSVND